MMGAAFYHLHWSPAVFWSATPMEFQAAQEAIEQANQPPEPGS
jgi:hypothetical protein